MKSEIKDDASIIMFAKMQVDGHGTGLRKSDWLKIIEGRAADLFGTTLHPAKAFTKCIVEDEVGKLLFSALKASSGSEIEAAPDAPQDYLDPEEERARAAGPNHLKLHFMAVDQQRLTGRPYASAYTSVYSNRENVALRQAVHREHIANAMARAG